MHSFSTVVPVLLALVSAVSAAVSITVPSTSTSAATFCSKDFIDHCQYFIKTFQSSSTAIIGCDVLSSTTASITCETATQDVTSSFISAKSWSTVASKAKARRAQAPARLDRIQ
ncbi:hypothetical protein RQP46_009311 [Phenoliferia psychrophenolica]